MKAKRIVSILLTGSMLLSLLPVSALAAAPVFDAPAQTTAKKAAPLVQEADASRSTEEEAATRSSRDLDAENGTAESITTIQLNADGTPAGYGDGEHWYYSAASGCQLDTGVFALQPSSEPEAESALKARLFRIGDNAELVRGTVGCETNNYGTIFDGIFQGKVTNFRTISGGTFEEVVEMNESTEGTTIEGGTFKKGIKLNAYYPTITDGLFDGKVSAAEGYPSMLSISGGLFTNAAAVSTISPNNLSITGGYFVTKPIVPEGSDIAFTTVSDQNGRTFQVPVNDGFSENGYKTLYVPHGMSERQANPITVKTDTALTDCLADGNSIMGTDKVRLNDDGSYTIEVYQPTSIVLVTEKPAPDDPGDEIDPGFSSGAAALGIVLGTAGLGYITYAHISSLYLYYTLPGGFIPSTRQELANVLWTTAGKPDPVSTALYTDIPADAIEQQKAARWCVEQGLLSDYGATFGPDTKVTNARIIRAWNSLKKVPVPITN
ncbi:hypothetical protein [Faecalibacterium prausnitzii]|uniref:hypothetical protein n=1 Tax=Faecalibacterium prausnitzii TaxID=853 RepID=UPI001C2C7507|nr:hypothetical protein [Faecalibacterium prausnitzii]MBV0897286.1 hypothetical protein [Faecalibacterium prausnitzii]MCQ5163275.1 hypothetical protein [Faecalibacterium prausnitzii]MCQ5177750.1 hypothetical protein [Faecalibacterium prausnitzii]